MSKEKMQKSKQEGLHDEVPDKTPWWKNRKRIMLAVIAVICALLGVGVWLFVMSGRPDGSVPCVEDGCRGYYINGICSKDSTHYEPAAENNGYYEITNAGQFLWFGAKVNAGENEIKGRLMNDIDLNNHVWTPIGSSASPFAGIFDGGGYTINNLNVQNENACGGMFGHVTGIVRNFTVYGEITMAAQTGDQTEGQGLIGYASGASIGRIESYVNITAGAGVTEVGYVGGIVGDMRESAISQSIWYGTINMDGANAVAVGGIAGHVADEGAASIADCAGYGTIKSSANGRPVMGGLVGYVNNDSAVLYNCVFAGEFDLMRGARDTYVSSVGKLDAISPATNALYYLQDAAPNVQIGDASLEEDVLVAVTAEELSSGRVAWLLNGKAAGGLWKQTIGKDAYPNFKGAAVVFETSVTGDKDGDVPVYNDGVYEIYNERQLFWFAEKVNSGDNAIDGKLMNDIDLKKQEWTAIGSKDIPYSGTFDGGGFAIRNLKMKAKAADEGFFGCVSGGTVKSFTIYGHIEATKTQTKGEYSGIGVIGCATKATVTEIQSCVAITLDEDVSYLRYVGGIVGYQKDTDVSKCIWWGYIDMNKAKADAVGGIVGYNYGDGDGSITDCASYGAMKSRYAGTINLSGIIGYINNPNVTIKDCIFAGRFTLGGETKKGYVSAVGQVNKVKELSNVYYEELSAPNVRKGSAVLEKDAITAVTFYELRNNAAVKRLNGERTEAVWEQSEKPAYPVFVGMTPPAGYPSRYAAAVYYITNADELFAFAQRVNSGETDICAVLKNDIYLDNREWMPIGTKDNPYMGIFDGDGFSIRDLNVKADAPYEGLFGYVSGGTVKDFAVYGDISIVKSQTTKSSGVGVIGYANKATISRIYSCLDITVDEKVSDIMYVGGIVGNQFESAVSQCIWWGDIDLATAKTDQVGGIVGYGGGGTSSITDCASYGTFRSSRNGYIGIGGILGYVNNENMTVANCLFAGSFDLGESTNTKYCNAICNFKKVGTVDNVYCEEDAAPNVRGGEAVLADDAIMELEKDQIKSGEMVAYLNDNRREPVWEQISEAKLPTIIGMDAPDGFKDFEIYTADQLFEFAQRVNSGEMYLNAKLMNDIDLGGREWTPIGASDGSSGSTYTTNGMNTTTQAYRGSFDGNEKTISGLKLTVSDTTQSNTGLFGLVVGGEVKDFAVEGEIQITVNDADCRLGVIGWADYATISGIESSVNITVADGVSKCKYVGGIVGDLGMCSTIEKCVWYGTIDAGKCTSGYFAGIVGRTGPSAIANCASYGTLKNSTGATAQMHGIVGFANHADISISSCLFAGTMENNANAKVSAIANIGANVKTPYSQLSGLYYEEGSAPNAIFSGTTAATGTLASKVTALESAKLSNGAAVMLLNAQNSAEVWKLDTFTIGGAECALPGFDGETITAVKCAEPDCDGVYQDGFCSADPAHYEAAELVSDVYEIYNAGQLFWFAEKVNDGDTGINGKLMNDVDLGGREWTPIGAFDVVSASGYVNLTDTSKIDTTTQAYRGSFDGNGKTISGLNLTTTASNSNAGLFGVVIGGTIKNFAVDGEIRIAVNDANGRIGVIGQCDYTTVSGIESSVNITVEDGVTTSKYVGGVVGDSMRCSTVEKCVWYGVIDAGKCTSGYFGGIVGRTAPVKITNCASYGTLKGTTSNGIQLHGIVGFANHKDIKISNCLFAGKISDTGTHSSALANVGNYTLQNYSNLYYEVGSAANAVLRSGSNGSNGSATNNAEQQKLAAKVTALESAKLSNGEAVLLLNGQSSAKVWKLDTFTIGGVRCKLPGFNGMTITTITKCAEAGCDGACLNGFCSEDPTHYEKAALVGGVYQIGNGGQLFWFADQVNSGKTGVKAMLIADIDLEENPWTPIGTAAKPFVGIFDGNGKTISGLNLTTTGAAYEGLFGYVLSSTVKNFTVDGKVTVSATANNGNLGVIGYAGKGTIIQKITSNVEITVSESVTNGAYQYIGGIVGNLDSGLLEKCVWDGIIDEGNWTIKGFAGIAGRMGDSASVTNCASYGTLKSKNANAVLQGIVGWANNPDGIRSSLFAGKLLYEGTGNVKYFAIGTVGESCAADKLTGLYYVDDGYAAGTPGTAFSKAKAVTYGEATSRDMVWKLNGEKNSGNWRYNTTNNRPEFVGDQVRK